MTPSSARALRRRQVADLRAAEPGLSLRQMADRLGISRDTVSRDLAEIDRAAAESAPPADQPEPVADEASSTESAGSAPVADPAPQVSEGGRPESAMPGEASAEAVAQDRPPAALPRRVSAERIEIDLRRWPALRRGLAVLEQQTGQSRDALINQAVVVLQFGCKQAVASGRIQPGEPFIVRDMTVGPATPGRVRPRRPISPAPPAGA